MTIEAAHIPIFAANMTIEAAHIPIFVADMTIVGAHIPMFAAGNPRAVLVLCPVWHL